MLADALARAADDQRDGIRISYHGVNHRMIQDLVRGSNTLPLAERWDGRSWKVQNVPLTRGGVLAAVSCLTANACTVTGANFSATNGEPLADGWSGRKWA
jgi:hypothetical protein